MAARGGAPWVEPGRLGYQDVGPFGVPAGTDLVFRVCQFLPGSAYVDGSGVSQFGRLPRNGAGQDEVHLAGAVPVAEGLQGCAVAAGKGVTGHVHQSARRDIKERGPRRWKVR